MISCHHGNGSVRENHYGKIYLDFYYLGKRVQLSTGEEFTLENYLKWRNWLDVRMEEIRNGTFIFSHWFPQASPKQLDYFGHCELQRDKLPCPDVLTFGQFYHWVYVPRFMNKWPWGKKRDFESAIKTRVMPFFENIPFSQINRLLLVEFVETLVQKKGPNKGQTLSRKRTSFALHCLFRIWREAVRCGEWELKDPFDDLAELLPGKKAKRRKGMRYDAFFQVIAHLDQRTRALSELMILTGMYPSELNGLKKIDLENGKIHVRRSIVAGATESSDGAKTPHRLRVIPITATIQRCLNVMLQTSSGEYLCRIEDDLHFSASSFYKKWMKACSKAGITGISPIGLRHSFAAWSLAIGIPKDYLVSLMGHASKKMVDEQYGHYIEGLHEDKFKILAYFGADFFPGVNAPDGVDSEVFFRALEAARQTSQFHSAA